MLTRACPRPFSEVTGNDRAHDGGLADDLALDGYDALHSDGVGAPVEHLHLDAELIAGNDRAAELGGIDAGEDHQLVVAVGDLGEQERAAGLGDGFDHEDAGHDGVVGEVALELGLVERDVFDGDDALLALDLDDAVDEEEGIAMRQEGHDLEDVHGLRDAGGVAVAVGATTGFSVDSVMAALSINCASRVLEGLGRIDLLKCSIFLRERRWLGRSRCARPPHKRRPVCGDPGTDGHFVTCVRPSGWGSRWSLTQVLRWWPEAHGKPGYTSRSDQLPA